MIGGRFMLNIGDKVKMNGKYFVADDNKGRIFSVAAEPKFVFGKLCVWLQGYRGCYLVDGLERV